MKPSADELRVLDGSSARNLRKLERIVGRYRSALVAFSGGVDSSLALAAVARVLPSDAVLAVTSNNETYLPSELEGAVRFVRSLGVEHLVVDTRELDDPNYASNPANRCYFCKSTLYSDLKALAEERGFACVVDGANKDRSEEHTSELQSRQYLVCRLLLDKKNYKY